MDKFDKEIEKRNKPEKKKHRYYFHGYQLLSWWCYPIAVPFIIVEEYIDKRRKKNYRKLKFTSEKAKIIIDRYFYKSLDFDKETNEFIFCKNWRGTWGRKAKKKDIEWCYKFDKELYSFLKEEYTIPNVSKRVEEHYGDEFVIFKKE